MQHSRQNLKKFYYFLKISYDGSYYQGYAKQPNHSMTIQGVIESLLTHLFHQPVATKACSRTDRYVHALDQAVSFSIKTQIQITPQTMMTIINENLPLDIRVSKINALQRPCNPRQICVAKTYLYLLSFNKPQPLTSKYLYAVQKNTLNLENLNKVLKLFVGNHNFESYFNYHGTLKPKINFHCEISNFHYKLTSRSLRFFITGKRFGRNMVRLIIGDVLDFLRGKISLKLIRQHIQVPSKAYTIFKAPPQGLYLYKTKFNKIS